MPTHTTLKGFTHIGESLACENIKSNLVSYFNWGFLCKGAFFNVSLGQAGSYGGYQHRLRLVNDPNYTRGQVWEGFRQDWVWESGVEYAYQPIAVSGVYVNSSFHSRTVTGTYKHHVNYPLGRIIFDTAISPTSLVTAEYSYRWFHFISEDQATWFKKIQFDSFRVDSSHFLQDGSGAWEVLAYNRVQLPVVVVQTIPRRSFAGVQLGQGQYVRQDILFHIFAETEVDRDKIFDAVSFQNNKTIHSYDLNKISNANRFPLDRNGTPVTGAMMYPDLVAPTSDGGYFWKKIWFVNMTGQETKVDARPPLYSAVVRGTLEIDFPEL